MKKNEILWIDFIKVVATFLVVLQHASIPLLNKFNELPVSDWWAGNLYYGITRVSVPLFFLLSGHLLLARTEPLKSFFAKRISKVVPPLVVWSIAYILWKHFYADGIALSISSFYSFLLKPEYYHLWFLYVIIGLYLYTPILRVLVQNATIELLYYFLTLWVLAVFFLPFLEKAVHMNSRIDLKMISGYVGYMVLGHLLGKIQVTRKIFWLSVATLFTILFSTATVTYALTAWKNGGYFGNFYSYLAGNIIVMSAVAFLSLRYISEKIGFMALGSSAQFLKTVNATALGIYLIHPMILLILKRGDLGFSLSCFSFKPAYSLPLTAAVTFSISFVIIYLLRKIPVVQKCVP